MSAEVEFLDVDRLEEARRGSYYTIRGVVDIDGWIDGINETLVAQGIGKPSKWYRTIGAVVNEFTRAEGDNRFQPELGILMFPLDGLNPGLLAMFKMMAQDTWFDDMVANMRPRVH